MRNLKLFIAAALTASAGAFAVTTLVHALWIAPEDIPLPQKLAPESRAPLKEGAPIRLKIPAVGIDANVEDVGISARGAMSVPHLYQDVGWYRYGPAPGEEGSAVIDGHVDNGFGLAGVFKHLNEIKAGDEIVVTTTAGDVHFVVDEVATYDYHQVPTSRIFTEKGDPRLVLITCEGEWVEGEKTYDHRLVIYASLQA
ncbi:class F sortase [Candidatus Parcubacteria bacterium]|nr:class F sortase [Candidatus Parcubacteria bacterium]